MKTTSITLEDVARWPLPGMSFPTAIAFSPDDTLVTYLFSPEGTLVQQLFGFDPATMQARALAVPSEASAAEANISREEALRRERQRQAGLGVTQYAWAKEANRLLVPQPDGLYVQDGPGSPLRRVIDSQGGPILDPQFSPGGEWIAYVQDAELYVAPAAGGEPRQLTYGARGTGLTHGLAEYVAQEEMGRSHGFWWACDGRWLAFEEVDETHIPVYRIVHQGQDATGEAAQEDHRYPFAGQANARVRLGIVAVGGGEPLWLDLGPDPDIYLARVDPLPDGALAVQVENREQVVLDLIRFDPSTGVGRRLLREENATWINLHDMFRPLAGGGNASGGNASGGNAAAFIWASERTGFRHLYLYDAAGELVRPLTEGEWQVDAVAGVDEDRGNVYFTATRETPLESHLYIVPLAGGEPRRLTPEPGMHAVVLDHRRGKGARRFVDTWQSLEQPPRVVLRSLEDGAEIAVIHERRDPRIDRLGLEPPEMVSIQNRAGTLLYGALYRPPDGYGPGPYPTVIYVYGGPHAQLVTNGWALTVTMRAQYLRSLGFLIFVLDNRGMARRGQAFEASIKGNMGRLEVEDQVDGVRWLVGQGLADPGQVGIYGWSYGGYMAAMSAARAPATFRAAVAGAPVTAWDGYDTHYTERYMGTPQGNPQGYADSSVMTHAANLKAGLMLVHGLIDENVHFRHTARLVNALIRARVPYELLLFPDERHMPRRLEDRVYMEQRIVEFLQRHLGQP